MTTTVKTIASATTRSRARAAGADAVSKAAKPAAPAPAEEKGGKPARKKAAATPAPALAQAQAKPVRKPVAKAAPKSKPAPRATPVGEPSIAGAAAALVGAVSEALSIRKKELVERVVSASGAKKKQVKEIVEHTLKVLGDALAKGEELNLPPFGKAKVNRSREGDKGTTMMVKVKQGGDQQAARKAARKGAKEGLAGTDD